MDEKNAKALLRRLVQSTGEGWHTDLPKLHRVFGQRIRLRIDTAWKAPPTPEPNADEIGLAVTILKSLDWVIPQAEREYLAYCAPHCSAPALHARNPSIQIWRETLVKENPEKWRFFIGRDDWEDGSVCVEFVGLNATARWGGD